MKIVQLIDRLKRGGGAESLVYSFAKAAKASGITCSIVCLRKSDAQMYEELSDEGIVIKDFPGRRLIDPIRFGRMVAYLNAIKPDVVHTHLSGATILGVASARIIKKPSVVTLHNVRHANKSHLYHGRLEAWLLRNWANQVIAVGDRTANAHTDLVGDTPMHVIPNAVRRPNLLDHEQKLEIRSKLFPNYDGPVIASVGSLTEQKDYANLLHALAQIDHEFKCMIVGEGPLGDQLGELARSLSIADKVKFLGLRPDVNDLLGASDIYVSSSLWEGLPVATLEAMYTGLPVISTAVGDAEIILKDDTGILVNSSDSEMLAREIARLLSDKDLRQMYGRKSFARVDSEYNCEEWMNRLKAVYSSVTN